MQLEVNAVNSQDSLFISLEFYLQVADVKNGVSHGTHERRLTQIVTTRSLMNGASEYFLIPICVRWYGMSPGKPEFSHSVYSVPDKFEPLYRLGFAADNLETVVPPH